MVAAPVGAGAAIVAVGVVLVRYLLYTQSGLDMTSEGRASVTFLRPGHNDPFSDLLTRAPRSRGAPESSGLVGEADGMLQYLRNSYNSARLGQVRD